ncbi:MAG: class III extradiol dioxygenase subunit B-like domain-containing protein [Actinomycetes bacterium]
MLVAAAFLPHPPVLVPEVAAGAAPELAGVREACALALQRVLAAEPDLVIVVGDDSKRSTYRAGARGSFAGFGVPVATALPGSASDGVGDGAERAGTRLPLSLAVGAWLMQRGGPWPTVRGEGVPATMGSSDAASLGKQWAASSERVALIVMGDGAATLTVKAPGYLVEGAEQWQKQVTQALADADLSALRAITPADTSTVGAAGRVAWQVAAGAADGAAEQGDRWVGELLADDAPYGVAYVVALWQRAPA